jgi:hypothetical protein
MAGNSNNTKTRWLIFSRSLIQLCQSRPGTSEDWAFEELQRALIKEFCGVSEGVPIAKFRYPWGSRMVDLVALLRNNHITLENIRWPSVQCNLAWLDRDWSLSAPAMDVPASVVNTESSVAGSETTSVAAMTTEPTQQIAPMSRKEQSLWLKTTFAHNPPGKDEPLTPEGYGKRIADMGAPLGAMYEPSTIIARYYQLNPGAPRRRKPRK